MPELLEVEAYANTAALVIGRTISRVDATDDWYVKGDSHPELLSAELIGATISGVRRIGKLMLLDTDGAVLGMRFGMTGRLLVDDSAPIEHLEYASRRDDPAWERFALDFEGGGRLAVSDPRRLGGVELDPDEGSLGPDAASVDLATFVGRLASTSAKVKAALLDQHRVAGLGNLLVDEILWRAGISPGRRMCDLRADEVTIIHKQMNVTLDLLRVRGGSHTGDLQVARVPGATCPADGSALRRESVGGRTTYWCPHHQL